MPECHAPCRGNRHDQATPRSIGFEGALLSQPRDLRHTRRKVDRNREKVHGGNASPDTRGVGITAANSRQHRRAWSHRSLAGTGDARVHDDQKRDIRRAGSPGACRHHRQSGERVWSQGGHRTRNRRGLGRHHVRALHALRERGIRGNPHGPQAPRVDHLPAGRELSPVQHGLPFQTSGWCAPAAALGQRQRVSGAVLTRFPGCQRQLCTDALQPGSRRARLGARQPQARAPAATGRNDVGRRGRQFQGRWTYRRATRWSGTATPGTAPSPAGSQAFA